MSVLSQPALMSTIGMPLAAAAERRVHERRVVVGHRDAVDVALMALDLRVLGVVVRLGLTLLLGSVDLCQRAPEVGGRILGALVDDAPEAAVVAVGDHREPRRHTFPLLLEMLTELVVVDLDELEPQAVSTTAASATINNSPLTGRNLM